MNSTIKQSLGQINPFVLDEPGRRCSLSDKVLFVVFPVLFGGTLVVIGACFFVPSPVNICAMVGLGGTLHLYALGFAVNAYYIAQKKRETLLIEEKEEITPQVESLDVSTERSVASSPFPVTENTDKPLSQIVVASPRRRLYRVVVPLTSYLPRHLRVLVQLSVRVAVPITVSRSAVIPPLSLPQPRLSPPSLDRRVLFNRVKPFVGFQIDPISVLPPPMVKITRPSPLLNSSQSTPSPDLPQCPIFSPVELDEEEALEEPVFPKKAVHSFVDWLFAQKEESAPEPLTDEEKVAAENIKEKHRWLYFSEEFRRIRGLMDGKGTQEENKGFGEVIEEGKTAICSLLEKHYTFCADGYCSGRVEELLETLVKQVGLGERTQTDKLFQGVVSYALLPFFLRLYVCLEEDRTEVFPWFEKNKKLFLELMIVSDQSKAMRRLSHANQTLFDAVIILLKPLNQLLSSKKYAGKVFFTYILRYMAHAIVPLMLDRNINELLGEGILAKMDEGTHKRIKKIDHALANLDEKSGRIYESVIAYKNRKLKELNLGLSKLCHLEILTHVVSPFLASFMEDPKEVSIQDYLDGLERFYKKGAQTLTSKKFKKAERQKKSAHNPPPPREDLLASQKTLDFLVDQERQGVGSILDLVYTNMIKGSKHEALYTQFITEMKEAVAAGQKDLISLLGDSVSSPGDFFVKSMLLAESFAAYFTSFEERFVIFEKGIEFFISYMEKSSFSKKELRKLRETISSNLKKLKMELAALELTLDEMAAFKVVPIHTFLWVLSMVFSQMKDFHLLRPFLAKHQEVLLALIMDLDLDEVTKYKTLIEFGMKLMLGGLMPINGLLNSTWIPLKDTGIKGSVDTFAWTIKSELVRMKEDKKLSEESEIFFTLTTYLAKFFLLGFFGTTEPRNTMQEFKDKLTTFNQKLYSFNAKEAAQDPKILQKHIGHCLTYLFGKEGIRKTERPL